jgi:hypothetical protein
MELDMQTILFKLIELQIEQSLEFDKISIINFNSKSEFPENSLYKTTLENDYECKNIALQTLQSISEVSRTFAHAIDLSIIKTLNKNPIESSVRIPWTDENANIVDDVGTLLENKDAFNINLYYPIKLYSRIKHPFIKSDIQWNKTIKHEGLITWVGSAKLNYLNSAFIVNEKPIKVYVSPFTIDDHDIISMNIKVELKIDQKIYKLTNISN